MPNHRNRFPARRRFLKQSTALTATVVALPLPALARTNADATVPPEAEPAQPLQDHARTRAPRGRRGDKR
jgi:hypothetical protein